MQEASDTAHEAAEAVLEPHTSAGFYDEESDAGAGDASAAAPLQTQPAGNDDRFLSLATGEAQADATDVGSAPATSIDPVIPSYPPQPDLGMSQQATAEHPSSLPGSSQQEKQPASEQGGGVNARQAAASEGVGMPMKGYRADDEASIDHLG